MKILVINVSLRSQSPVKLFPIGLGYITTSLKNAGYSFDLLDIDAKRLSPGEVDDFLKKHKYDVICAGCIVTGYKIIKDLALRIKKHHPDTIFIVGNSVASSIVDILLTKTGVDIAVIGEGDLTIVELMNTIKNNRDLHEVKGICFKLNNSIIKNPPRPPIKDISNLPFIDFSSWDVETYIDSSKKDVCEPLPIPREEIRALPVSTARGCIGRCTFCYHVFKDYPYRRRSAESIVAEIKSMIDKYSLNYIQLWDDLTFFSKEQVRSITDKIIDTDLKFYWVATCRANLFDSEDDYPLMQKLKDAGCIGLGYSLESSDTEILKAMNKRTTVEQFSRQTKLLQHEGIPTLTSLVFGYPQETPETIKKTFDCCIENKVYPSSGYLLPQPGSVMYSYAKDNQFITDEEEYLLKLGDRQDLRLNMTSMSDEEFRKCVVQGLERCNAELNVGLSSEQLIKSQYFRASKKKSGKK
jgi:radical SAM superfamily enzyme YgiQ (UPF0313 family)